MLKEVDVLIVGQGIAGTCLAYEFLEQKKSILILDNAHKHCSSIVAAGIVNPIVFKRLTKSWNVDKLLSAMQVFYERIEKFIGANAQKNIEILKLFTSIQEQNQWIEKSDQIGFESYLGEALSQQEVETKYEINAPYGGGVVKNSCYIDLPFFLTASRSYFQEIGAYLDHQFDFEQLNVEPKRYQNISFKKIVFCEGHQGESNPYFKNLPFKLAKGEVLEFTQKNLKLDRVINKNGFVLPTLHDSFKLGATYEWNDLNENPTSKGKQELLSKLVFLKNKEVEVINHMAGIRPTVSDRRPLLGESDLTEGVYIFNGLGTKGALIAPYYAKQLVDYMFFGIELEGEVDIKRFSRIQ